MALGTISTTSRSDIRKIRYRVVLVGVLQSGFGMDAGQYTIILIATVYCSTQDLSSHKKDGDMNDAFSSSCKLTASFKFLSRLKQQ